MEKAPVPLTVTTEILPLCSLVRPDWEATLKVENFGDHTRLLNQEQLFYNST